MKQRRRWRRRSTADSTQFDGYHRSICDGRPRSTVQGDEVKSVILHSPAVSHNCEPCFDLFSVLFPCRHGCLDWPCMGLVCTLWFLSQSVADIIMHGTKSSQPKSVRLTCYFCIWGQGGKISSFRHLFEVILGPGASRLQCAVLLLRDEGVPRSVFVTFALLHDKSVSIPVLIPCVDICIHPSPFLLCVLLLLHHSRRRDSVPTATISLIASTGNVRLQPTMQLVWWYEWQYDCSDIH